jgi:hypothetical protein
VTLSGGEDLAESVRNLADRESRARHPRDAGSRPVMTTGLRSDEPAGAAGVNLHMLRYYLRRGDASLQRRAAARLTEIETKITVWC